MEKKISNNAVNCKKHYYKHRDKLLNDKKTYYQLHKDTIKARNLQRYYDKKILPKNNS